MKNAILITLAIILSSVYGLSADSFEIGKWKFYDGSFIKSTHDTKQQCVVKMEGIQALDKKHTYNCVQRITRIVDAVVIAPEPLPDPTPIPDPIPAPIPVPEPPPATGLSCIANANPSNYLAKISAGGLVCLSDGIYTSGAEIGDNVILQAANRGKAEFKGGGVAWKNGGAIVRLGGNNSIVDGLKVHFPTPNPTFACTVKGSNNIMRNTSCSHGGGYKHSMPLLVSGSNNLIEDSWFFGKGRYVIMCSGGSNNTLRRNVVRWDKTNPNEPNEPNAAMSNYSCNDTIWENNISLDYGKPITNMVHCGDFCMSTTFTSPNLRVKYLGNIVVNHAAGTGNNIGIRADQKSNGNSQNLTIKDMYINGSAGAIVINPKYQNTVIQNCTTKGVNSDGSLGYQKPVTCDDTADISARYIDGIKTNQALFPFANEALIKTDMCASGERQSDWCKTNLNLTEYIQTF